MTGTLTLDTRSLRLFVLSVSGDRTSVLLLASLLATGFFWMMALHPSGGDPKVEPSVEVHELEEVFAARNKRIRDVCRKYNVTHSETKEDYVFGNPYVEHLNTEHYYMSRKTNVAMCYVYKVASTSFGRGFLGLELNGSELQHFTKRTFLKPHSEDELRCVQKHGFTFMFVRHPMERLLSCYLEKIYFRPPHRDMDKGLHKIEEAFRKEVEAGKKRRIKSLLGKDDDEGDEYLFPQAEIGSTSEQTERNSTMTFVEFLSKVLVIGNDHDHGFTRHWSTFWTTCSPCTFSYDVVGKLESEEEFQYVWSKVDFEKYAPSSHERKSVTSQGNDAKEKEKSKQELLIKFYSTVPRPLLLAVYRAYQLDFELYDYNFNEFLRILGHEPLMD